jgi:antitoxin (DNA-binding transcriptional repressor) of toxin-antitoxin stability system
MEGTTKIMPTVDTRELVSISDATKKGLSRLVRDAAAGHERILLRNNKPVAAVVSMQRLEELEQREEDVRDIALGLARLLTAGEERISLDEVLGQFGYTREQLRAHPAYSEE